MSGSLARIRLNPKVLPKLMGLPAGVSIRSVVVSPDGLLELLLSGDVPDVHGSFVSMKLGVGPDGRIGVDFGPVVAPAPEKTPK